MMRALKRLGLPAFVLPALLMMTGRVQADGNTMTVSLAPQHHSGVSAKATLTSQDGATVITLTIDGRDGASYLPDVRRGTCKHGDALPEIPLALASASASTETTVDLPRAAWTAGSYILMLHEAGGTITSLAPEDAVACGEIGGVTAETPIASSAPVAGSGPLASNSRSETLAVLLLAPATIAALLGRGMWRRGGRQ